VKHDHPISVSHRGEHLVQPRDLHRLYLLTLSRVQFAHPVSVREHRPVALAFMVGWLGTMTWLALA
jgi:hypothetical protein